MMENSFKRFLPVSPALTLALSIFTLGLYVPYWLYTRSRILNNLCPEKTIPSFLITLCMASLVAFIYMAFQLPSYIPADITFEQLAANPKLMEELMAIPEVKRFQQVAGFSNMMQVLWAIIFCQRLNYASASPAGSKTYASYFILFLSVFLLTNVFYLQYKINQLIDSDIQTPGSSNNTDSTIGLM